MKTGTLPHEFRISERLLRRFEPKNEWLAHDSLLHGVGHMARVLILQELIADRVEQAGMVINREALRYAAMAHDVGRHDDGIDSDHGRRSAEWIRENMAHLMMPELLAVVTYIVAWHVPPDAAVPTMTVELQVLKDADGLDRVRLGDLNPAYLRTEPAGALIETAEQLYERSLPVGPGRPKETFASVLRAAKELGLVR